MGLHVFVWEEGAALFKYKLMFMVSWRVQTGCRLALISEGVDKALVFEPDYKQPGFEDVQRADPKTAQVQG